MLWCIMSIIKHQSKHISIEALAADSCQNESIFSESVQHCVIVSIKPDPV